MVMRVASSTYISQAAWRSASSGAHWPLILPRNGRVNSTLIFSRWGIVFSRLDGFGQRCVLSCVMRLDLMTVCPAGVDCHLGRGRRRRGEPVVACAEGCLYGGCQAPSRLG